MSLTECIRVSLRALGANKLRALIKDLVLSENAPLTLFFESFAFKMGVPLDAEFMFDVRAIPNPYYDLALRPLTGRDEPVIAFLDAQPSAEEMFNELEGGAPETVNDASPPYSKARPVVVLPVSAISSGLPPT